MEKLIFFGLVIPIFLFVLYLGGTAIMTGFSAKEANRKIKDEEQDNISPDQPVSYTHLTLPTTPYV